MLRFILSICIFISASAANAGTHKVSFIKLGNSLEQCNQRIEEASLAFGEATGHIVAEESCSTLGSGSYRGTLTYIADESVEITNTKGGFTMGSHARFETSEDCAAALADEISLFSEQTGLNPFYSFCVQDTRARNPQWLLSIEAIGESAINYNTVGAPVYGKIIATRAGLKSTIFENLERLGVVPVDVIVRGGMASGELIIHYYADARSTLNPAEYLKFKTEEECLAAKDWSASIFEGSNQVVSFCGAVMGKFELEQIFLGQEPLGAGSSTRTFDTIDECLAEESALNAKYSAKLGTAYKGGRCAYALKIAAKKFALVYFYAK